MGFWPGVMLNVQSSDHRSFMMQKRAIRIINNAPYNGHTEPLFKKSRILKLYDLYEYQCIMFMFDYRSMNLPKSFEGVFIANK